MFNQGWWPRQSQQIYNLKNEVSNLCAYIIICTRICDQGVPGDDVSFYAGSATDYHTKGTKAQKILNIISVHPVGVIRAQDSIDRQSRVHGGSKAGASTGSAIATVVVFLECDIVSVRLAA